MLASSVLMAKLENTAQNFVIPSYDQRSVHSSHKKPKVSDSAEKMLSFCNSAKKASLIPKSEKFRL